MHVTSSVVHGQSYAHDSNDVILSDIFLHSTRPTSKLVLGPPSKLALILGLTLVYDFGPCTRVNPRIDARVDNRPCTNFSVGLNYVPHSLPS